MLQPSINLGLAESDFWNMTPGEIERFCKGAIWRLEQQAQFDYILADLIGVSAARMMSSKVEYPAIEQVYPSLFKKEPEDIQKAKEEEIRIQNSTNRFMEWALKHNAKKRDKGVETT